MRRRDSPKSSPQADLTGRLQAVTGRAMSMDTALDRITKDPAVMGGKPCLRGMRVTVGMVLRQLGTGTSIEALLADYPYLEREDVLQALRYAGAALDWRERPQFSEVLASMPNVGEDADFERVGDAARAISASLHNLARQIRSGQIQSADQLPPDTLLLRCVTLMPLGELSADDLTVGHLYAGQPDRAGWVRVVDASGEDYVYPEACFQVEALGQPEGRS